MTQKEKVARHLVDNLGHWIPSYDLHKTKTRSGFLGIDADTRAYDLVREGYETPNASYVFEKGKIGRYARFRCVQRIPKSPPLPTFQPTLNYQH